MFVYWNLGFHDEVKGEDINSGILSILVTLGNMLLRARKEAGKGLPEGLKAS